ncbi:MAG TPA: hypothetical protein PLD19_08480 [Luteimonas sp.]|nr:hypothetical protein [Luteimonas sp.]
MPAADGFALLAQSLIVGVSGHRKLRADDVPRLRAEVRAFLLDLQARHPRLPVVLLSPLAEGSDQLAAEVALDLGLRVVAPLPLPLDLYLADFTADARQLLERQLPRVEVLAMPLAGNGTLAAVSVPGPARDQQYAQAGIFVSDHCHVLLALWDGQPSPHLGGTAQVVGFHLYGTMRGAVDRQPAAATLLGPDQENIVRHLPAARAGAAPMADPRGRWLTEDGALPADAPLPAGFARMFSRQAGFDDDVRKYAGAIATAAVGDTDGAARCPVWRTFNAADWLARLYQQRVARVLRSTYVLVALMGIAFFTYTDVIAEDLVIYAFLVLFLVGGGLSLLAHWRQWQRKYLDYRTLAEGLRVQSYWRRAGIVVPGSRTTAHENFLQKQDTELGWIRNVMRGASVDGMLVAAPVDEALVDAVIDEWIGTPDGVGQLAYYGHAAQRRTRLHHRAERIARTCIGLGVASAALLALFAHSFDDQTKLVLVSAMGILSVAAAVQEAYMHKKADKELIRQYGFMQRIFAGATRLLAGLADDPDERRRVLVAVGEAALTEHAEWSLMHRERPLPTSRL